MSANSSQTSMTFKDAPAQDLPKLIQLCRVSEVMEGKVSSSEKYIVQPVQLDAIGAGRSVRVNLLYRPEWLRPGFDPQSIAETIDDEKEASSVLFVYRKNIAESGGISVLRGLAGSDEAFDRLANQLLSQEEVTIEGTTTILREFLIPEDGEQTLIGVELRQKSDKTGDVNPDTGKNIYIKTSGYDIDSFYDATEKNIKSKRKFAEKSNGRARMTFTEDDVF